MIKECLPIFNPNVFKTLFLMFQKGIEGKIELGRYSIKNAFMRAYNPIERKISNKTSLKKKINFL